MPRPKRFGERRHAWDVRELDVAVDQLPSGAAAAQMKVGVMLMPRKRPPFVELWRDRHGKVRVYFRKEKGPRLPLPDAIGSDEFNAAYQAALLGQPAPVRDRFVRAAPGTLAALVASYMKSAEYIGLRDTSKAGYISGSNAAHRARPSHRRRPLARAYHHRHSATYADRPARRSIR